MEFQHEQDRIFALSPNGDLIAEVTFPISHGVAIINHTFVDQSLRGKGTASQLLTLAAAQIKKSGFRALPTCSYAVKWFGDHPEYSDLLN